MSVQPRNCHRKLLQMTVTLYCIFIFLSSFYFVFHYATKNIDVNHLNVKHLDAGI